MTFSRRNSSSIDEALALRTSDPAATLDYRITLLQRHLQQAGRVPFYQELFRREGVVPTDFHTLGDLARLPLTTRTDLDRNPQLFRQGDESEHRDITLTSGTTNNFYPIFSSEAPTITASNESFSINVEFINGTTVNNLLSSSSFNYTVSPRR